jgi:cystathionine beta-synthase
MQENGFWEDRFRPQLTVGDILASKKQLPLLIYVDPKDKLSRAIDLMRGHNISQLPVMENGGAVGSLNESLVMKVLHDGLDPANQVISAIMAKPLPTLEEKTDASEAYRLLLAGAPAVIVMRYKEGVVTRKREGIGLITRADLIVAWTKHRNESSRGE